MDEETLTKSIGYYEAQLDQVNEALDKSTDDTTRDDLEKLRNDIKELLQLTKASLLAVKKQQLLESVEPVAPETKHSEQGSSQDDEYSLFEAELADAVTTKNNTDQSAEELQKDLASLEGSKCRAPFSHQWGQMNYCNAVVLQVEANDSITSISDIKVRVMFCNPFSQAMQPCPYFLDGKCRFSDEKCRYSHGHVVNFQELQEFKEPDFSYLQRDTKCFAKHNDGLWHLAVVEEEEADHHFTVKFTEFGTTAILSVEDILPLDEESNDDSSDSDAEDYVNISNEFRSENDIKPSVFDISTTKALGGWEQHTKGIGSKLMMQMGYITGQGLGKHGEGRTEPIEAVILPAGKSLDKCMELKEKGSLQNPERKKKRLQKKEKLKAARVAAGYNYRPKQSVFDFLNSKLSGKPGLKSQGDSQLTTTTTSKQSLKTTTSQNLNVEALRISDGIRKAEKELVSLRKSLERNQDKDRTMSSHLRQQISIKEDHLKRLQKSEHAVHKEQTKRNDTKKLTLF